MGGGRYTGQRLPEYRKTHSATPPPVLRHQAEAQITICTKPGAHEVHMGRTWGTHGRTPRKKKLKSLYLVVPADWGWGRSS